MNPLLKKISLTVFLLAVLVLGYLMGTKTWSPAGSEIAATAGEVSMLPEFSLPDLNGKSQRIGQWSGNTMIINFWATWCAPCRREMPLLQKVHEARKDHGLAIIGIAIDRPDAVQAFIAETGVTYPILAGEEQAMAAADLFGADFVALPFTVFVAPSGEILRLYLGEIHPENLEAILAITDQVADGRMTAAQAREQLAPL